jgi:hypothetical protein
MQIVVVEIPTMIRSKLAPAKGFKFVKIQEQCQLYSGTRSAEFRIRYNCAIQNTMEFRSSVPETTSGVRKVSYRSARFTRNTKDSHFVCTRYIM